MLSTTLFITDAVCDLGVTLDSELSMQQHVNKVAWTCFFHIGRLKQVCQLLQSDVAAKLTSAFVLNRLDYCNVVLASLTKSTIAPLQLVQNVAAVLASRVEPRDHMTSALQHLHWLPVQQQIIYKLCLLMHPVNIRCTPSYLTESVTATAALGSRSHLRSTSSCHYQQPHTQRK